MGTSTRRGNQWRSLVTATGDDHFARQRAGKPDEVIEDPEAFLQNTKSACYRIQRSAEVTMTHNDAWHFIQAGRLIERADLEFMDAAEVMQGGVHPWVDDLQGRLNRVRLALHHRRPRAVPRAPASRAALHARSAPLQPLSGSRARAPRAADSGRASGVSGCGSSAGCA